MTTNYRSLAAVLAIAAAGLAASGAAQARSDVSWSIGLAAPGAQVVVGNAPRLYVQPQPVYVQPAPVYVQPQPVYYGAQPVYVQPRPVYVQAPPVYIAPQQVYPVQWVAPGYYRGHGPRFYRPDWRR